MEPRAVLRPIRAAQYLRMSRESQTYSLAYQTAHNAAFAREHGFELVRTYTDAGISGLRLAGREGLKALLADVIGGAPGYEAVLVYDVSRWGRFQDVDQGAHYEFLCRTAGVRIIYTAELFDEDGGLATALLKQIKRAMAAEFSRELSAKIARAQGGLARRGFWVGGPPGYGLRRQAVTMAGAPRARMERGQQKGLRGERTILVHGPPEEVATVRRIYSLFLTHGLRIVAIADRLNREGVPAEGGAAWTVWRVRQVLTNEKYAGVLLCEKSWGDLGRRHRRGRGEWIRVPGAVAPIISPRTFALVQAQFRHPHAAKPTDEDLLEQLRRLLRRHGRLSRALIDADPDTHCADLIRRRFGGLVNATRLAGGAPTRRQLAGEARGRTRRPEHFRPRPEPLDPDLAWAALEQHFADRGTVSTHTIDNDPALPSAEWYRRRFGGMAQIYLRLGHTPTVKQRRHMKAPLA